MIAWFGQADSLLLGPFWFAGCVLLGGGALIAWAARIPSWRVRISELAFLGMAAWLVLALVPMPRLGQAEPIVNAAAAIAVVDLENMLAPMELALAIEQANATPLPVLPEQVAAPRPTVSMLSAMTAIWLLAAVVSLATLLVGALLLWRLLGRSYPADASVQRLTQQVAARLGLKKPVDVRIHDQLRAPFCCQLRTVVLPKELLTDRTALRAVLAHELAHIAAADPLRRTLFALLTPLFILHPAWWVLRRMSTQASEEAADARAAMALGRTASQYARPLIELSARLGRNGVAPLHPSIVGVLGQPTSFTRRMTMLLTRDPAQAVRSLNRRQGVLATASTLLALAFSVGAWGTPASAQSRVQGAAVAPMDQSIRPDFTDCALRDALLIISRKSGLSIAIDTDVAARKIRIKRLALGEMPVRRLLDTLAVAHDLRWKVESDRVVFRTAKAKTLPVDTTHWVEDEVVRRVMEEASKTPEPILSGHYREALKSYINRNTASPELLKALMETYQQQVKKDPESLPKAHAPQRAIEPSDYEALRAAGLDQAVRLDPSRVDERNLRAYYKLAQEKHDEILRRRSIDAAGLVPGEAFRKSLESIWLDSLRKANKSDREEKAREPGRKAFQKAYPDMPAEQIDAILKHYGNDQAPGRLLPGMLLPGYKSSIEYLPGANQQPNKKLLKKLPGEILVPVTEPNKTTVGESGWLKSPKSRGR